MSTSANAGFVFALPEWLDETPSTNDELKARLAGNPGLQSGFVLAARRQTRGRGRMGNVWLSSPAGDLTFSFLWRGCKGLGDAGVLPIACGLGVRDFLSLPPLGLHCECKWPNDVLVDGAKICGILTEGGAADGVLSLVVGIGVNVRRAPGRDKDLGRPTACLEEYTEWKGSPEELLLPLLPCLARRIGEWERGGFAAIRSDVEASLWGMGGVVAARTPGGSVSGVMVGLGEGGELLLRDPEGRIRKVTSVHALEETPLS